MRTESKGLNEDNAKKKPFKMNCLNRLNRQGC